MPGIAIANQGALGTTLRLPYALGNSLSYRPGDLVVFTSATDADGTLRLLATADATALYENAGGDYVGVLGVMDDYITTNSTGYADSRPDPITRAAGIKVQYMSPSRATSLPIDSTQNRSRSDIYVIEPHTVLSGTLLETTTVNEDLLSTRVGLDMTVTSGVTAFKWSTAAATPIGTIVGVKTTDRLYNVSGGGGRVYVKIDSNYCQYRNNILYAT